MLQESIYCKLSPNSTFADAMVENIRKNKPDKGLVNIKQYLTENEISELYKLAMYSKIQLVLIEFNMYGKKSEYEDIYIIDKDSCIITY